MSVRVGDPIVCEACGTTFARRPGGRVPRFCSQKCRRTQYAQPCVDCGKSTDGSGGFAMQRTRCNACNHRLQREQRVWNHETIVEAIHEWAKEYGAAPAATAWRPGAYKFDAERYYEGPVAVPSTTTVFHVFGSWRAALLAAGFESQVYKRRSSLSEAA